MKTETEGESDTFNEHKKKTLPIHINKLFFLEIFTSSKSKGNKQRQNYLFESTQFKIL